jgi:hypothetical protein
MSRKNVSINSIDFRTFRVPNIRRIRSYNDLSRDHWLSPCVEVKKSNDVKIEFAAKKDCSPKEELPMVEMDLL